MCVFYFYETDDNTDINISLTRLEKFQLYIIGSIKIDSKLK